jgi:F-type H+-transporting ATPase subunit gamma
MAGGREIKTKIKSVQNTRKVTRALEMVSASKIRRAQEQMRSSRPYVQAMRTIIGHLAKASSDYQHPFMIERAPKRVGYLVISSDRGLCGGLNTNQFKLLLSDIKKWQDQGCQIDVVTIGNKAGAFLRRLSNVNLIAAQSGLGDRPALDKLIGSVKIMLDAYSEGKVDRLFVCYNDFVNTMVQTAKVDQLLPLPASDRLQTKHAWDYIYEPDAKTVLDHTMTRYVEALAFQAVLENLASEHASRMVAMKSASDNAGNLIQTLTLIYNKARQAAITQEISEIVGGAAAV